MLLLSVSQAISKLAKSKAATDRGVSEAALIGLFNEKKDRLYRQDVWQGRTLKEMITNEPEQIFGRLAATTFSVDSKNVVRKIKHLFS